jgi:hypothetical protein
MPFRGVPDWVGGVAIMSVSCIAEVQATLSALPQTSFWWSLSAVVAPDLTVLPVTLIEQDAQLAKALRFGM